MTEDAPPGRPWALPDTGGTIGRAALGGTLAFAVLVAVCVLLAVVQFLLIGAYGLWSWVKIGLLTALLSLRAEMVVRVQGPPFFRTAAESMTLQWRFVPMVLTIGFLWLAARAGRRAVRAGPGRSPLLAAGLAAGAAGAPVAILSAVCSTVVALFFPTFGLRVLVDAPSAALWAGILAAAGAATGAYLEAARGRPSAAAVRGGLTGYGWALALLAVGVFVVATLEPAVTRRYAGGVSRAGALGGVLFGYHVLALPAQSALLLAPASGSCVEIIGEVPLFDLCPWRLVSSGPVGEGYLPEPLPLSPWLWLLSAVPFVAALLGGRRAVIGAPVAGRRTAGIGVAAGLVFAFLIVAGGWIASPQLFPFLIPVPQVSVHPGWVRTAITALIWGVVGGGLGALFAARRYAEPELPRPTSA